MAARASPSESAPGAREDTRDRLIDAAIEVFAEEGYHHASTREICRRAGVNPAAIHYHFGDKASLYRAVFRSGGAEPAGEARAAAPRRTAGRHEALVALYRFLLAPLAGSELHQQLIRLYAREEIEPSGVLGDTASQAILPRHRRLTALLAHELGLDKVDVELERLALSLVGMGAMFYHLRHVIPAIEPRLISGERWLDDMAGRLADYADVLIRAEDRRRRASRKDRR